MDRLGNLACNSLIFWSIWLSTTAFNVDVTVPIVKEGPLNSYFGFSVAQHHIQGHGAGPGRAERVIIVGAPQGNITHHLASPGDLNLNKPGVVYHCPMTSDKDDCTEIRIDEPENGADKNGKWLGVSVASQGTEDGGAVACAHRYATAGKSHRWGLGICTTLSNSLDEDQILDPCGDKDKSTGHGAYGMCQAGTSLDVSSDGDVLVGLPGPYNWRGAIFKNIIAETFDLGFEWYTSPVETVPKLPPPGFPDPVPMDFDSYMGMSSAIGVLLNDTKTYVGGAPHSEGVGQVLLFTQGGTKEEENSYLELGQTLNGDQFGANYGYSLEILDLNNDRKQDLVVGAPLYHGDGFGGAIYIYMNGPDGLTSEPVKILSPKMTQKECELLNCETGQFGLSLASLGDVDRDGFEDLAVGAPFEGDGAIYIFRGSGDGLIEKYSQRIVSEDLLLARPMISFGSSLKGGMDMDDNGYPDLVVGAFESNKALILRSRPVIAVEVGFEINPKEIDPSVDTCIHNNKKNNCFKIRICFKFTAEPKDRFSTKIKLNYKLIAEVFTGRKIPRVYFKGADKDNQHQVEKVIELNEQTSEDASCDEPLVYLISNNRDFLHPIQIQLTYALEDRAPPTMTPGDPIPDINSYPVLDEAKAEIIIPVEFKKNCGADNKCQSQLILSGTIPKLDKDEADGHLILKIGHIETLEIRAVVTNKGEDAHEASLTIVLPEKMYYVNATRDDKKITCNQIREDHTLICPVGNPLGKDDRSVFKITLDPKGIQSDAKVLELSMRVNTTSVETDPSDDFVKLTMKVVVETDLQVNGYSTPPEVSYGGSVIGEHSVKYEDQIGNMVNHTYVVSNGPGTVSSVTVYISWPYQVENGFPIGKHLLYLMEAPVIDPPGKCFIDPDRVNVLDVTPRPGRNQPSVQQTPAPDGINAAVESAVESPARSERVKRENVIPAQNIRNPDTGKMEKVVVLDCDKGSARCFTFHCVISPMKPDERVNIQLRSRLWNSTFLEDYRDVDHVRISSKARIEIDPKLNIRQNNTDNDIHKVETRAVPDIAVKKQPGIPTWVIVVAAVAGVLLLILLVVLLWKCGFFKRTRAGDVPDHKGTLQKKKKGKNSTYNDDPYN